ncbi:hypothetical protein [Azohydromonas sediminis]|uniref:hypothetical protein n=1 Tax=Azohydromonas sediminis TaxID=2259674 RepID=UPI0013C2BBBA|nr:hypothetical protein [Azohydromonas sediminis]
MLEGRIERDTIRPYVVATQGEKEVAVYIYAPRRRPDAKPAVIFLSGCDGGHHQIHQALARQLNARGAVVAEVQSIEALGNQCSRPVLNGQERTVHAFMARDLLVRKGVAAPDNVALRRASR